MLKKSVGLTPVVVRILMIASNTTGREMLSCSPEINLTSDRISFCLKYKKTSVSDNFNAIGYSYPLSLIHLLCSV